MKQIYGDEKTIERVRQAPPGDPHIYVNLEAIDELPEQFEVHLEKVTFDFEKDFVEVGNGNYMPTPSLMNDIAQARGIDGTPDVSTESIIEEIDISPLLCKPLGSEPILRKQVVGKRCVKTGRVLQEDGTYRTSDPCGADFNAWDRCLIEWAKEEEATNGYDSKIVKDGMYEAFGKKIDGKYYEKTYGTKTYQYGLKYDNKFKRQRHFAEMMKFAQRQADTKARHIVIRVLAGLKTGYQKDEIKDGYFIFPKIRRSRLLLKMETAADLQARSKGITTKAEQATTLLFGGEQKEEEPFTFPDEPKQQEEKKVSPRDHLIAILEAYKKDGMIVVDVLPNVEKLLSWLSKEKEPEKTDNGRYWERALMILKQVEQSIPEEARIDHQLYQGGQS